MSSEYFGWGGRILLDRILPARFVTSAQRDELSDGTLRYLLLVAALLTPRPPSLMVLNESETSLHPDLLPALARLIIKAAENSQVWVVTHAKLLISALSKNKNCNAIQLEKEIGRTQIAGENALHRPPWHWPD